MSNSLCPYFSKCAGCSLQQIDYEQQLEWKKKFILNLLVKTGMMQKGKEDNTIQIFADKEYHYRNKMEFLFLRQGLGLRRKDSSVIKTESCAIANEEINKLMQEVNGFFREIDYFNLRKREGTFRGVVIRATTLRKTAISFVLNEDSTKLGSAIEIIKLFGEKSKAENIVVTYVPAKEDGQTSKDYFIVKGKDFLQEKLEKDVFDFPIQGFFQNNTAIAEKMVGYTTSLFNKYDTQGKQLLDLYGGVGIFGIGNAVLFEKVIVVEGDAQSIKYAQKNFENNGIKHGTGIVLDAKKLKKINFMEGQFIIVDPPRTGMDLKTIEELKRLKPKVIVYISCNPQQLAKDLMKFNEYKMKSVALFDLFPQTMHAEVIVELERK